MPAAQGEGGGHAGSSLDLVKELGPLQNTPQEWGNCDRVHDKTGSLLSLEFTQRLGKAVPGVLEGRGGLSSSPILEALVTGIVIKAPTMPVFSKVLRGGKEQ